MIANRWGTTVSEVVGEYGAVPATAAPAAARAAEGRDRPSIAAGVAGVGKRWRYEPGAHLHPDGGRGGLDGAAGHRRRRFAHHVSRQRHDGAVDARHDERQHGARVRREAAPPRWRPARLSALPRPGPPPGAPGGRAAAYGCAVAPPRSRLAVVHRARYPVVGAAADR